MGRLNLSLGANGRLIKMNFKKIRLITFKVFTQCLIALLVIAFAIQARAQTQRNEKTEIECIKTVKGDLMLIKHLTDDYVEEVSLKFKDQVLLKAPYQYINIRGKFGGQTKTLFLVFLGTDALVCIGKFVIVDLSGNSPKVTQEFGNCSDAPKIAYTKDSLILNFPDGTKNESKYSIGKKEVWRYSRGVLRKLK